MSRLVVIALNGLLLLSGCGGNPKPQSLPSEKPSTRPTPSASGSPTTVAQPPVMPEEAKAKTKAGAIAFARHYVDLINFAQATGDTKVLASVEAKSCQSCAQAEKALNEVYGQGGEIAGGQFVISSANALDLPETSRYLVELGIEFGPQTVSRPGKPDQELQGGKGPLNLTVEFARSRWQVVRWTRGA